MAVKSLLGHSIVANIIPGQLPDNERLVPAAGQDHVRVLGVGGDLGHPSIVAPKGASQLESLGHDELRHFLKYINNLHLGLLVAVQFLFINLISHAWHKST